MPSIDEWLGRVPPADASGPQLTPSASPMMQSYEELRPYIRPSLFEALKPHIAELERTMALRNAAPSSYLAPLDTSPQTVVDSP